MKEQLISFETAKLAKEKGFNHHSNGARFELSTEEIKFFGNDDGAAGEHMNGYEFIKAPTQSLLQKWLREEYDIHVVSSYHKAAYGKERGYDYIMNGYVVISPMRFLTYEKALEQGLQKALKLI